MENIEYLKNLLISEIKDAESKIPELYKDKKLSDDLDSYYEHQIGYYEAVKYKSQTYLDILTMNDDELMLYKIKQYRIKQENEKTFREMKNKCNI